MEVGFLGLAFILFSLRAAGFETYDRFVSKKDVLYAFFIVKNGVKNVL
jgi:hypothetical protein